MKIKFLFPFLISGTMILKASDVVEKKDEIVISSPVCQGLSTMPQEIINIILSHCNFLDLSIMMGINHDWRFVVSEFLSSLSESETEKHQFFKKMTALGLWKKEKIVASLACTLPYLYTTLQEHIDLQGTQEGLYAVDGEEVLQLLSERMQLTPGSQQKVKANPVFLFKPKYFGSWPVFSQEKKDLLDKPKSFIFSREIKCLTLHQFPESLSKRKDHDYLQGCQLLESVWFINSSYTGALPLSIRNLSISGGTYTKEGISRLVSGLDLESINLETLSKDLVRSALWAVKNKNAEASVQYTDSSGKEHRVSMNNIAVKKMISKLKKHNF